MMPIYLDNNATTPLDPRVKDAMLPALESHFGNPASNTHAYGWYAAELVEIARENVARCIGANPKEIVFTSSATESINLALKGFCFHNYRSTGIKSKLITIPTEHKATLDTGYAMDSWTTDLKLIPVDRNGFIDKDRLDDELKEDKPCIFSISLANNEIGTIQNVKELVSQIKNKRPQTIAHVDASQAVGKMIVDVKELNVDLLSFSAHKIYGPKGSAALYINKDAALRLEPLLHGGSHEHGLRAGTLNVAGIVGFGKAAELVSIELDTDIKRIKTLTQSFFTTLKSQCSTLILNGPGIDGRLPGNLNLLTPGVRNVDLISRLSSKIAFSISSACTSHSKKPSHVLEAIGLTETEQRESFRIGVGKFTTQSELDSAAKLFAEAISDLS